MVCKVFTFLFVALFAFYYQEAECFKCTGKKYTCPATAITANLNNPVVFHPIQRNLIVEVWNSSALPPLTVLGQQLVAKILFHVNTDSPSLLNVLYNHAIYALTYLSDVQNFPPICNLAATINASNAWVDGKDGQAAVSGINVGTSSMSPSCVMVMHSSLRNLGCVDPPMYPPLNGKCWKRGFVYNIELALTLSGQSLPCSLKQLLLQLYDSSDYTDRILAATFMVGLSQINRDFVSITPQATVIETIHFLTRNSVTRCCCEQRLKRLKILCAHHNTTVYNNAQHLIDTIYLAPECKK